LPPAAAVLMLIETWVGVFRAARKAGEGRGARLSFGHQKLLRGNDRTWSVFLEKWMPLFRLENATKQRLRAFSGKVDATFPFRKHD